MIFKKFKTKLFIARMLQEFVSERKKMYFDSHFIENISTTEQTWKRMKTLCLCRFNYSIKCLKKFLPHETKLKHLKELNSHFSEYDSLKKNKQSFKQFFKLERIFKRYCIVGISNLIKQNAVWGLWKHISWNSLLPLEHAIL